THKNQQGDRCLWTWRGPLPTANWPSAFCRRNKLSNNPATIGHGTAATAFVESKSKSRSFHHLPEVPRERSTASLLVRCRIGRRPRTLVKARTNSGKAKWIFHACGQMGAPETRYCCADRVVCCSGGGV